MGSPEIRTLLAIKEKYMIKLILSDMDGTLLDENGQLPEEFDEVMAMLKERDILFAPASGRQHDGLQKQFAKYKDDFVFVAENGTYVTYKQQELFSTTLKEEHVKVLEAAVDEIPGVYTVLCGKKSAYVMSEHQPFVDELSKYYTSHTLVEDFSQIDDEIIKFTICDCDQRDAANTIYSKLRRFDGEMQVALSGDCWVDVMNYGVNKGVAVQRLQQILGISARECVAFGDYLNDLEMMGAVRYSFAMENAHPKIKQAAAYQAKSNADHGVMLAIKDMLALGL